MTEQQIPVSACSSSRMPENIKIREWKEADIAAIQKMSSAEGWTTPQYRPADALHAWRHSSPTLVAVEDDRVIGFLRGVTDGAVTTYIAEILVEAPWRGKGIGKALLEMCHDLYPSTRLDLLSTASADGFYEANEFRPFRGFRKSFS